MTFPSMTLATRTYEGYGDGVYHDVSQDFDQIDVSLHITPVTWKPQAKTRTGAIALKRVDPTGEHSGTCQLMLQFVIPKGFTDTELNEQRQMLIDFLTEARFSDVLKARS